MKLLAVLDDEDEALLLKETLEDHGIPVYLATRSGKLTYQAHIWVCLDSQFDDAVALRRYPGHEVRNPVDVQSYYEQSRTYGLDTIARYSVIILVGTAALLLAMVYVYFRLSA